LNNLFPGFHADGTLNVGYAALSISPLAVVPPSAGRAIGDALIEKSIPWVYYGGGFKYRRSGWGKRTRWRISARSAISSSMRPRSWPTP
jgi:hypothetical protein